MLDTSIRSAATVIIPSLRKPRAAPKKPDNCNTKNCRYITYAERLPYARTCIEHSRDITSLPHTQQQKGLTKETLAGALTSKTLYQSRQILVLILNPPPQHTHKAETLGPVSPDMT